jgi:RIO kinase 1
MFRDTYRYAGVWGQGTRHEDRAMRKNTKYGQAHRHARWIANELANLTRLFEAGVTVPPPVELVDGGYRMAFIGEDGVAAPRLESVVLDRVTAEHAWRELMDEVALMLEAERVHGDLSAYNVLWWRGRCVLIDFSQTVDAVVHPAARELVVRDVTSLARYFRRCGVRVDVDAELARIGADDRRFAAQAMRVPAARDEARG